VEVRGRTDGEVLYDAVRAVYDIEEDDRALRQAALPDARARGAKFEELRRTYRERREFPNTTVSLNPPDGTLARKLQALGFRVSDASL